MRNGYLEVHCGPMCSGKSDALISILGMYEISNRITGKNTLALKVTTDTRDKGYYSRVGKHYGEVVPFDADFVQNLNVRHLAKWYPSVVADEIHLLEGGPLADDFVMVIKLLVRAGVRVHLFGLDADFRGEPFDIVSRLVAEADSVHKMQSICSVCGDVAQKTQRLVDGEPARYTDEVVVVEERGHEHLTYEPRCRKHHVVR